MSCNTTGDTLWLSESGQWTAAFIEGISDAGPLAESLELLATVAPGVVISSAFADASAVHRVDTRRWLDHTEQAHARLSTGLAER